MLRIRTTFLSKWPRDPLLVLHLDDTIPGVRRLGAVGSGGVGEEAVAARACGIADARRQRHRASPTWAISSLRGRTKLLLSSSPMTSAITTGVSFPLRR